MCGVSAVSCSCTLWSLCRGRGSWRLWGARSAIRSYCNNKNWKLVFQILDKVILPLGMKFKKHSRETGSLSPPRSFWKQEQNCDLFQEFKCPTAVATL